MIIEHKISLVVIVETGEVAEYDAEDQQWVLLGVNVSEVMQQLKVEDYDIRECVGMRFQEELGYRVTCYNVKWKTTFTPVAGSIQDHKYVELPQTPRLQSESRAGELIGPDALEF